MFCYSSSTVGLRRLSLEPTYEYHVLYDIGLAFRILPLQQHQFRLHTTDQEA